MSYVTRMPHLSPARVHLLVALCVVAVVSFSLGLAAAPLSRRLALLASRSQPVAEAPAAAPAITGARYDAGWAGGPGQGYQPAAVGDPQSAPPVYMTDHQSPTDWAATNYGAPPPYAQDHLDAWK